MNKEQLEKILFKLIKDVSIETENYIDSKGRLIRFPMKARTDPIMEVIEQYALTKQLEELEYIPTKLVHIKDGLGLDCGTVNALDPYYRDDRIADLRSQLTSNKSK